jgi:hypothetical protein
MSTEINELICSLGRSRAGDLSAAAGGSRSADYLPVVDRDDHFADRPQRDAGEL